ncbi:MAG: methyltransferase domain-containing protein [Firmicutes bacterium]|nr:methyltransferase domain-containing protein [Bacillota bacterium]
MHKALLHLNHTLIKSLINEDDIVVDMTCGNGFDTEFLAQFSKHVYAFDIQFEALQNAKSRLSRYLNITYIHDSFVHVSNYIQDVKLYVFNLGYLPGGDKSVTTKKEITLKTIIELHEAIMKGSHIIIMSYVAHDEGLLEYTSIHNYFIENKSYQIYETKALHYPLAPVVLWIQKKDSK